MTSPRPLSAPRIEVRLAGSGGQGIILAGLVLSEAAGVFDCRQVAMVQSYGPEARGGASKAEIIISDAPIDYPLCIQVDLLLAMTQEASDAYCWDLKPAAWVIVDRDLVPHPPTSRAIPLPLTTTARDRLKSPMAANMVALGAISEITGLVSRRSLEKALERHLSADTTAVNKKALSLGIRIAGDYIRTARVIDATEAPIEPEDM